MSIPPRHLGVVGPIGSHRCELLWHSGPRLAEVTTTDGRPCMYIDFGILVPSVTVVPSPPFPEGADPGNTDQALLVRDVLRRMSADSDRIVSLHAVRLDREVKQHRYPYRTWGQAWLAGITVLILLGLVSAVLGGDATTWDQDLWRTGHFALAFPVAAVCVHLWRSRPLRAPRPKGDDGDTA